MATAAVLMYDSNEKKISGHQNLLKNQYLTGHDMTVFVFETEQLQMYLQTKPELWTQCLWVPLRVGLQRPWKKKL